MLDLTSPAGIATIACTITDPLGPPDVINAFSGCGTHPDARIALTRALTEAAQSRLSCIQGGRENLPDYAPAKGTPLVKAKHRSRRTISFDDIASYPHASVNDDVEFMIERLRQSGFEQVVVVDVTSKEVGIPVVRVIVPALPTIKVFAPVTTRPLVRVVVPVTVRSPPAMASVCVASLSS